MASVSNSLFNTDLFTNPFLNVAKCEERLKEGPVDSSMLTPTVVRHTVLVGKEIFSITTEDGPIYDMIPTYNNFVTRSVEGSLNMWNSKGNLVDEIWTPKVQEYKGWMTKIASFGPDYWMTGTCDGGVDLWSNHGDYCASLKDTVFSIVNVGARKGWEIRKKIYEARINCLAADTSEDIVDKFYAGINSNFFLYETTSSQPLKHCHLNKNISAIRPLAAQKVLVVAGSSLQTYTSRGSAPTWRKEQLFSQTCSKTTKMPARAISDVSLLEGNADLCVLPAFNGTITILDMPTKTPVLTYAEHADRVWQIANIGRNSFASCSDDQTIKIYDVRAKGGSLRTIFDDYGRVSSILALSERLLISASCLQDPKSSSEKACLTGLDIRKL